MQDQVLEGLFDELDKIAASRGHAGYMQTRQGRRPIRASTLLSKPQLAPDSPSGPTPSTEPETFEAQAEPVDSAEEPEGGQKIAEVLSKERKEKALEGFAKARPYVVSGVKGAVPGALVGKMLFEGGKGRLGRHGGRTLGLVGAALGVTNEALQQWAEKHKRKAVAKQLLER